MPALPCSESRTPASPDVDEAGVDRAQIRAMLDLGPEERLQVIEDYLDSVLMIRRANETGSVR